MERSPRSLITIDLGAIAHNVRLLRSRLKPTTLFYAAVKADGYGHGALPVAQTVLAAGGDGLAVATAEEALELREQGISAPVLVMGPLFSESQYEAMAACDVEIAVVSRDMVWALERLSDTSGPALKVHIKVDTGMNRQGVYPGRELEEALEVCRKKRRVRVVGIMTHFASAADEPDSVPWQLERFAPCVARVKAEWPDARVHAANSAAVLRHPESQMDMVRCGIAVYGLSPFQDDPSAHGLKPALAWESQLALLKHLAPGEGVGYGLTYRSTEPRVVGLVPIGYADGVFRALGNRGSVAVRGKLRPMIGRVSMDSFAVDLGDGSDVRVGDRVVLIGADDGITLRAEDLARWASTINYEITCAIRRRRAQVRVLAACDCGVGQEAREVSRWT